MKRSLFYTVCALIACSTFASAQSAVKDTLAIHEGFFGLTYTKGAKSISSREFEDLLKSAPDKSIYKLYAAGETESTMANVLAFAGGFSLGYGLSSKPTNSTLAIAGGVVAVVSLVLDADARSMMNAAVNKYNALDNGNPSTSRVLPAGLSHKGLTISLSF